jgi:hypothetical protein
MKTKRCWVCKETKTVDLFYKNRSNLDGLTGCCKECEKQKVKERYRTYHSKHIERFRKHYEDNKETVRERQRNTSKRLWKIWYEKNKEKHTARAKLRYAVGTGKLQRPTKCTRCPSTEKIQGHHPDYTKPLEVIWLCHKCHEYEHHKC